MKCFFPLCGYIKQKWLDGCLHSGFDGWMGNLCSLVYKTCTLRTLIAFPKERRAAVVDLEAGCEVPVLP